MQIHGEPEAHEAQRTFEKTFQERKPEYPMNIPLGANLAGTVSAYTSLASISDAKRIIQQGGVEIDEKPVLDPSYKPEVGQKIKIGKKIFGTIVEPEGDKE